MASNKGYMSNTPANNSEKRLLTAFVELLYADAVLVLWTQTKNGQTKSRVVPWGNMFAVKGLLEWAYDETFSSPDDEEDNEDDENDDD